jgi:hypothetical protein
VYARPCSPTGASIFWRGTNKKPRLKTGGARKVVVLVLSSVCAQIDRPAGAGMMEPVMMRETEHLVRA